MDTDEKIQYAPAGIDHVLVGDLEANCNYSCTVWEHTVHGAHHDTSEPMHFTTEYGGISHTYIIINSTEMLYYFSL